MSYLRFLCRIVHHKYWVIHFGLKVGGVPLWRLVIHDWSKFSRAEFGPRCRNQILGLLLPEEFQAAVDHHHVRNPHHWQYWVQKDGRTDKRGEPVPMPETYVREMIADWLAAQKTYRHDLGEWFEKEFPSMNLHPATTSTLLRLARAHGVAR